MEEEESISDMRESEFNYRRYAISRSRFNCREFLQQIATVTVAVIATFSVGTCVAATHIANSMSIDDSDFDYIYDAFDQRQMRSSDFDHLVTSTTIESIQMSEKSVPVITSEYITNMSVASDIVTTTMFTTPAQVATSSTETPSFAVRENNYWALFALVLVAGTAAGNILVCLAIAWERRLQNVTNYFLMSLAITDLMVAILVMPLGILTLVKGKLVFLLQRVAPVVIIQN